MSKAYLIPLLIMGLGFSLISTINAQAKVVQDLVVGAGSSNPNGLFRWGNHIYFSATTPKTGYELYRSEGTKVELVADVVPGSSSGMPTVEGAVGDWLLFSAHTQARGRELYATKGVGFKPLLDLRPGSQSSIIQDPSKAATRLTFRGKFYFTATASSSSAGLYTCDEKLNIRPFGKVLIPIKTSYWTFDLGTKFREIACVVLNNTDLIIHATDSSTQLRSLFSSPGGPTGTVMLDKDYTGGRRGPRLPMTVLENSPLSKAVLLDPVSQDFIVTDGSVKGTKPLVVPFKPAGFRITAHSRTIGSPDFASGQGGVYFEASTTAGGTELFWTNGTRLFNSDINAGKASSWPTELVVTPDGRAFLVATDNIDGKEPRILNPSINTVTLLNIRKGLKGSKPFGLRLVGGRYVYFAAEDVDNNLELWRSGGSAKGASLVANICKTSTAPSCSSVPREFTQLGGGPFFSARTITAGYELMKLSLDGISESFGRASGAHNPSIKSSDPILGGTLELDVAMIGIPPKTPQAMLFFFGTESNQPYLTVLGVELYFSLAKFFFNFPIITAGPSHTLKLPIPNSPALVGAKLATQCLIATKPALETTKGVRLFLGK